MPPKGKAKVTRSPNKSSPVKSTLATPTDHGPALSLPAFLKLLCSGAGPHPLSMSQAMKAAAKLVPAGYNNLSRLSLLNQTEMAKLGIDDEETRRGLAALTEPGKKKKARRHKDHDLDKPLPDHASDEEREGGEGAQQDYDFDEILAEEALIKKSVVTNRAPVMTAWAMVVAERLGFAREEALSIAQVFTDLNATSKGVSLGIMDKSKLEPGAGPAQPFVDLMGRRVPVLRTSTGAYRAIAHGVVTPPSTAFSYITRSFRQQTGALVGSLRMLSLAFEDPTELNDKGYALYCDFRPVTDKWGEKSEMRLSEVLELRSAARRRTSDGNSAAAAAAASASTEPVVRTDDEDVKPDLNGDTGQDIATTPADGQGEDEFDKLLEGEDDAWASMADV